VILPFDKPFLGSWRRDWIVALRSGFRGAVCSRPGLSAATMIRHCHRHPRFIFSFYVSRPFFVSICSRRCGREIDGHYCYSSEPSSNCIVYYCFSLFLFSHLRITVLLSTTRPSRSPDPPNIQSPLVKNAIPKSTPTPITPHVAPPSVHHD
jgi:hypothetical protein